MRMEGLQLACNCHQYIDFYRSLDLLLLHQLASIKSIFNCILSQRKLINIESFPFSICSILLHLLIFLAFLEQPRDPSIMTYLQIAVFFQEVFNS